MRPSLPIPGWLRTVLALGVTLCVWFVTKPASADAPLCDDRAATGFAPAPILDPPSESVDVGDSTDCSWSAVDRDVAYNEGRGSDPWPTPSRVDATVDELDATLPSPRAVLVPLIHPASAHRPGVRARLERPPRI